VPENGVKPPRLCGHGVGCGTILTVCVEKLGQRRRLFVFHSLPIFPQGIDPVVEVGLQGHVIMLLVVNPGREQKA